MGRLLWQRLCPQQQSYSKARSTLWLLTRSVGRPVLHWLSLCHTSRKLETNHEVLGSRRSVVLTKDKADAL
jgi:hypothetical protein